MEETADATTHSSRAGAPPPPGSQLAHLAVRSGGETVRTVPIRGELYIGRDSDNDLVLDGSQVARRHARIYTRDGDLFLCNEASIATTVNDITLIGHRRLRDGDRIRVGEMLLTYHAVPVGAQHPLTGDDGGAQVEEDDLTLLAALRSTPPPPKPRPRRLPPWHKATPRKAEGRQRKPALVPTPAGLLVLVAIAAILAYLIAPDSFERRSTERRLTPVIAASSPGSTASPRVRPAESTVASNENTVPAATGVAPTPDEVSSFLDEARALTLRSQFDAAIERYQSLAEQMPDDARVEAAWAQALILDGDIDQGIVHAEEATELDPDSTQAWTMLARAYVAQGNASSALSAARRAVSLANDSEAASAHAALAEAYLAGELLAQAVGQADIALSYSPTLADALSIRGRLYLLADGDADAAVAALRSAAIREPELWVRHQELGLMLLELGQYRAAIEALTQAMVLCHKPTTYTALGRAHYQLGEYDQAKSYLEQSLSLGADDVETYGLLAEMNAQQGRCDDARVYYNHAFERDPAYPLAVEAHRLCEGGETASAEGTTPSGTGSAYTPTPGNPQTPPPATSTPPGATAAPPLPGWIAFSTWNTGMGHYDTYVARSDGSDRRLVAAQMHQPAFRPGTEQYPGGQWLALNGEQPLHMNIHIVDIDDGAP
ncbi:MAG: tetratricopeptide repeat protein, partial [Anaerolineae bacterium]